jgi:hypothetical protein
MKIFAAALLLFPLGIYADLGEVMEENNLEKRSEKALKHADNVLTQLREAYVSGDQPTFKSKLGEYTDSIDLAGKSLRESGKNARKSPKYFKRAEIALRKLNRRMDNFRIEMSVQDREPVEKVIQHTARLRDEILGAVMGKK